MYGKALYMKYAVIVPAHFLETAGKRKGRDIIIGEKVIDQNYTISPVMTGALTTFSLAASAHAED
jgi:hypothetical protein